MKSFVQKEILTNQKVFSLTVLRDKYIKQLEHENHPNPNFRSKKLIKMFDKDEDLAKAISYSKVVWKGCVSFWLVYNSELSISEAVAISYLVASED